MSKTNQKIEVMNIEIRVQTNHLEEYISLTDIARFKNSDEPFSVINNWMRTRSTIEFIGLWEEMYNPNFKPIEFERFKKEAGSNYFVLSPQKWVETTNSIGIISKSGRYGGTFAHVDIAFEFASWISSEFKLYLISEFKRLKQKEQNLEWNVQRTIAKINYKIHTDSIKENLIPITITKQQASLIYASEADVLNVALFGKTAKEWKDQFPDFEENIRDSANLEQLVVLSNMESINALLIQQNVSQSDRIIQLNKVAISQMKSLLENRSLKKLQ